ncbi:hypothetical protein P8C59_000285 [Phyllachora maydis]|uniref:Pyroglutamyl-peptidase I n=1 Tax=Phyllachora maydis TaxID=1825666 RepID=A0AAD9M8K7_9PEZI|nr:hypothetical protein P8C59_000285 [Phyllachora maydis]
MGSTNPDDVPAEFTVLVTGFGPFKEEYPVNPSWEIACQLPDHVSLPPPLGANKAPRPVRILVHPEPVRVSYDTVRALVPQLWRPGIDAVLHIGMASPQPHYSIERRAHRDGYVMKDVDGEFLRDQDRHARERDRWVWHACPHELLTDVDVDDVLARWQRHSHGSASARGADLDLRISEDPGRFLCDFIYFSSLAHLWKAGERRRVLFLHVPCVASETDVATGKDLVIQLIRSMVESELARGTHVW